MQTVLQTMSDILNAYVFMLPAYIGNITPLFTKWIPFNLPVDLGFSLGGKRIFGDHKTWRGMLTGIIIGGCIGLIQGRPLLHGAILALGNFVGDLVGAFVKRRLNIPPGGSSLIIDSVPSPFFTLLFAHISGFLSLNYWQCAMIIVTIIPFHIGANKLWHKLKLKSVSW